MKPSLPACHVAHDQQRESQVCSTQAYPQFHRFSPRCTCITSSICMPMGVERKLRVTAPVELIQARSGWRPQAASQDSLCAF
ncbi:MAG: hypothetical protein IANPNBLG_05041 [Bryobacteraceae bacterium]|nr:hypothetical protein [Bryobacteraceae bacterium]